MKKTIQNNLGKEISFNFYKCQTMFGTIQKYENDIVTLHHVKMDGNWYTEDFHESWVQNVRPLKEQIKQYVLACITKQKGK